MKAITIMAASLAFTASMFADGSYQETTQVTNGSAVQAARVAAPFISGASDVTRPKSKIVMVHGNRLVEVTEKGSQIIDLDKGAMTTTDNAKREYSTLTFEQLAKMMNSLEAKPTAPAPPAAAPPNPNAPKTISSDVKVENTGAVKQFGNVTAHETRLSVTVRTVDPASGAGVSITTIMDVWKADTAPGYDEVQAFYKRMAEKASWAQPQRAPAPSQPGAGEGTIALTREAAKIKGIPVLEVTQYKMALDGLPQSANQGQSGNQSQSGTGSAADQAARDAATQTADSQLSKLGSLGSILGKSGLGALGKKNTAQQSSQAAPAHVDNSVLEEITTERSQFSGEAAVLSEFEVPPGYKEVPSPLLKYFK
jgi:hypothetical protein